MFTTRAATIIALAAALAFGHTAAEANSSAEKTGKVTGGPPPNVLWCVKPPSKAFVQCTKAEYDRYQAQMRNQRQQKEMAAEQRAYDKMKKDRQQKATTTEHCYMKNGQLVCKQVP